MRARQKLREGTSRGASDNWASREGTSRGSSDDWASQSKGGRKEETYLSEDDDYGSKTSVGELDRGQFHSRAAAAHRERQRIIELERQRRDQESERMAAARTKREAESDSEEKSYDDMSDDYEVRFDVDEDDESEDDGGSEDDEEEEDIHQQENDLRHRRSQGRRNTNKDHYTAEQKPRKEMVADAKSGSSGSGGSKRGNRRTPSDAKADAKSSSVHSDDDDDYYTGPHGTIRPGKDGIFDYEAKAILNSTYRDLRNFLLRPVERGCVTRCYIERNRKGRNMFAPFYSLCADLDDGTGRELLVCKKLFKSGFSTSHYVFSCKSEDLFRSRERRSRLFIGKLRQSATGESYTLYDNGAQAAPDNEDSGDEDYQEEPDDSTAKLLKGHDDSSLYRKEHAIVHFSSFERPTPQKGMEVCIPNPTILPGAEGKEMEMKSEVGTKRSMARRFEKMRQEGKQNELYSKFLFVLQEKQSRYDPLSSCLVDFKSRANMASRRNFQIVQSIADHKPPSNRTSGPIGPQQDSEFILQMGKTTEECYNMDVKYPLSIFQAFAICIARFDAKLKKN